MIPLWVPAVPWGPQSIDPAERQTGNRNVFLNPELPQLPPPVSPALSAFSSPEDTWTGLVATEGTEQIEQNPHLPLFVHYTSINNSLSSLGSMPSSSILFLFL